MYNQEGDASISEILEERAATYSFLSQVYRHESSAEQLGQLAQTLGGGSAPGDADSEGYALLRQFAEYVQGSSLDKVAAELAAEFVRLFYGSMNEAAFPYESVYTSPERVMMQEAQSQVQRAYREEGLERDLASKEPEDHIAFELEFMAHLCRRAADALESDPGAARTYLEKQQTFLDEHLLVWAPAFCEDLAQATRFDFYRGIARLTQEHLSMERDTVDELLAAVA